MNAMKCACPTCKTVLQIAQALPVRVQCPKCSTMFTVAAPPGAPAAPPAAPVRAGAPGARGPAARGPASTAVRSAPSAPEPMLTPRNRSRRGYKPKKGNGLALTLVVVGLVLLLAAGGVLAAYFGGLFNKSSDTKSPENKQTENTGGSGGKGGDKIIPQTKLTKREIEIQNAIAKGVDYLKAKLLADDKRPADKFYYYPTRASDVGISALAGLTLLECEVEPTHPAVQVAYRAVHASADNLSFSYSLSLSILFLDRLHQSRKEKLDDIRAQLESLNKVAGKNQEAIKRLEEQRAPLEKLQKEDETVIHRLTTRILANQHVKGGWGYYCPPPKNERALMEAFQRGDPFTPTEPGEGNNREDSSINQFMTLALWTARRHKIKTDDALLRVGQRDRNIQNKDGSWGYTERSPSLKDATTCAGMIALAVSEAVKGDLKPALGKDKNQKARNILKDDPNIAHGMEYLTQAVGHTYLIKPEKKEERHRDAAKMLELIKEYLNAKDDDERRSVVQELGKLDRPELLKGTYFAADSWGDLYFLWSVERVAVVYDLKKIGDKDWFAWGSELILKNQQKNGSWTDRFPGIPDTCFALLFLKRANVVKDLTNKLRGLDARPGVGASPVPAPPPPAPAPARKE